LKDVEDEELDDFHNHFQVEQMSMIALAMRSKVSVCRGSFGSNVEQYCRKSERSLF